MKRFIDREEATSVRFGIRWQSTPYRYIFVMELHKLPSPVVLNYRFYAGNPVWIFDRSFLPGFQLEQACVYASNRNSTFGLYKNTACVLGVGTRFFQSGC